MVNKEIKILELKGEAITSFLLLVFEIRKQHSNTLFSESHSFKE